MDFVQDFLAYLILGAAVYFLLRKYVFRNKDKGGNCGPDCNC